MLLKPTEIHVHITAANSFNRNAEYTDKSTNITIENNAPANAAKTILLVL